MTNHERMLYQSNKLSQTLILLYLVGNTIVTIVYVNSMNVEVQLGIAVLLNIALSLIGFLAAIRQAAYAIEWGYGGIALGIFQIARILWMPAEIVGSLRILMIVILLASGALMIAASINCILRSRERRNFIVENNVDLAALQK